MDIIMDSLQKQYEWLKEDALTKTYACLKAAHIARTEGRKAATAYYLKQANEARRRALKYGRSVKHFSEMKRA